MPRAVVLLSGGLDSYTAAAVARRDGFELYALTVRYGQRHAEEIDGGARVAAALGVQPAPRARRRPVAHGRLGADRRHRRAEGSADRRRRRFRSPTCRRATPCSCRWRWAGPRCSARYDLVIGVNALDYSGYPDCRPEFIQRLRGAGQPGHQGRRGGPGVPRARAAARSCRRPTSSAWATSLGLDYGLTHSCYDPRPDGRPCGHCDSCRLRAAGFARPACSIRWPRPARGPDVTAHDRPPLLHRRLPAARSRPPSTVVRRRPATASR